MRQEKLGSDRQRERLPGATPPLDPRLPALFWLSAALALAGIVLALVPRPGPLDDRDHAYQRPGLLTPASTARTIERLRLPGAPLGRRPSSSSSTASCPIPSASPGSSGASRVRSPPSSSSPG